MTNHVNLAILTPGSHLTANYVKSLLDTLMKFSQEGISVTWVNEYASNVFDAREMTLNGSSFCSIDQQKPFEGNLTYDKLLWIDSDISWEFEDALKLYKSDKDIISGAYLANTGSVMAFKEEHGAPMRYEEILEKTDVEEISAAGFGFLCVKSGIFESLPRPWFQQDETHLVVNNENYQFKILGEDISFFSRVRKLGYTAWLDPTVRVTHTKTMRLTWEGIRP